jgi:ferrochelatase
VVSFGGPEGPEDVLPFLENVLRGRDVPRERMLAVAEHYEHFGGFSPINAQNRALIAALVGRLQADGQPLPVYWGNRNWDPVLRDTLWRMANDGRRRALAYVTSAYSSYSGCRQYREDIARACEPLGNRAPQVDKLRAFFNHPEFIGAMVERVQEARVRLASSTPPFVFYTAHSIPMAMAEGSAYAEQLAEAARLVSEAVGLPDYRLVYQSRSGSPSQPWLEPDVRDALRDFARGEPRRAVLIVPIGFLSDHVEILYDLDVEARAVCDELGIKMARAETVGAHPRFVGMIRELVLERVAGSPRRAIGKFGPSHDECPADCCLYRPTRAR